MKEGLFDSVLMFMRTVDTEIRMFLCVCDACRLRAVMSDWRKDPDMTAVRSSSFLKELHMKRVAVRAVAKGALGPAWRTVWKGGIGWKEVIR